MTRVPHLFTLAAAAGALALSGCLGSPEPYRPYKDGTREPRPDPSKRAEEEAALRLETELPIELARTEAELARGRKTLGRIMGEIPTNPWVAHERDLVRVLGMEHAQPHLPPGPPERLALTLGTATETPSDDDEGDGDEGDDEDY